MKKPPLCVTGLECREILDDLWMVRLDLVVYSEEGFSHTRNCLLLNLTRWETLGKEGAVWALIPSHLANVFAVNCVTAATSPVAI